LNGAPPAEARCSDVDPLREERREGECDAHERHVDPEKGGDAVADAANHGAVHDSVQPPRRTVAGGGFRGPAGRLAVAGAVHRRGSVDRSHLPDDLRDFGGRHHGLVRTEELLALVCDGLLEVRDDLGAVGVVRQRVFGAGEIFPQGVVSALVELIRVAIQVDADDFLHGYRPSCAIVVLRCFQ
jgi:hypothetical protein